MSVALHHAQKDGNVQTSDQLIEGGGGSTC